jgi:hypothetical protein
VPESGRPIRRAGIGRIDDGALVTWSVADGRRGRRWREVIVGPEGWIRSSLLLETDPDRRFSHLELSTAAGLLTLHPEGDGTLHGNSVTDQGSGVAHVVGLPWSGGDLVLVAGSAIGTAAIAWAVSDRVAPGEATDRAGVVIDRGLVPSSQPLRVVRLDADRWAIGDAEPVGVDGDGLPRLIDGRVWPLALETTAGPSDRG